MPRVLASSLERFKRIVAGFSVAQRTIAVIGAALVVMGIIALGSWQAALLDWSFASTETVQGTSPGAVAPPT